MFRFALYSLILGGLISYAAVKGKQPNTGVVKPRSFADLNNDGIVTKEEILLYDKLNALSK